ncbi:EAL domain-containing protein [Exiguobacterium sp. SH1S21]|uniref:putative bifunctional diguanylate cyclase/phosphodiesterase n=1 Tax=Exiguobacterium sp. SH1S21 TaxID=2510953 RepID=UPI00103DBA39|nr:EAL domain-containing protein [Exiguobacterium sp. SH1S21]TCI57426.1 EAL domain-containing protein [Exiguobacterium sp. SH1S21]
MAASKHKRSPLSLYLTISGIFLACTFLVTMLDNHQSMSIGILPFFSGMVSVFWMTTSIRHHNDPPRYWIYILWALITLTIGNFVWLLLEMQYLHPSKRFLANLFWIFSYPLFLMSLIDRTQKSGFLLTDRQYRFNLSIYMVMAMAVSSHFLLQPFQSALDYPLYIHAIMYIYQFVDLGILFLGIILYYMVQAEKTEKTILFLVAGLLLQATADVMMVISYPEISNVAHVLWTIAPLLIGLTGLLSHEYLSGTWSKNKINQNAEYELYLPYASGILLNVLVMYSYDWKINVLSVALTVTYFLIVGRQFFIIRENKHILAQMEHLAFHDSLTGLRNRHSLITDLKRYISHKDERLALLMIDLDRFKYINDSLGHHVGDKVLIAVAEHIRLITGENERLYRLGGDEFVVVLREGSEESAEIFANALLDLFAIEMTVAEKTMSLTPSIGISLFPKHSENAEDLLTKADVAMYEVKAKGKNNFLSFDTEMMTKMQRKMEIEKALKIALEKQQFHLVYQPKIDLKTNELNGVEALLRWNHPVLGMVSPMEFIPAAEETGMIIDIGEWVMQEACHQVKEWQSFGIPQLNVAVNVSVRQLEDENFIAMVKQIIGRTRIVPSCLELEITESIMQNTKVTTTLLHQLKELGVRTSIDDFGTGYSSLHVLQHLPIDALKIDQSFVKGLDESASSPMVKTIIELGLNLDLDIIAEGIETDFQLQFLKQNSCTLGQGYLLSKPLDRADFERYLKSFSFIH